MDLIYRVKIISKNIIGNYYRKYIIAYIRRHHFRLILTYHRIVPKGHKEVFNSTLYVTSETFEMHLGEMTKYLNIRSLREFFNEHNSERSSAYLTFDDGWVDNYTIAFPILKKYKAPATIFLSPNLVGKANCFWFHTLFTLAERVIDENKGMEFLRYFKNYLNITENKRLDFNALLSIIGSLKRIEGNKLEKIIYNCFKEMKIEIPSNKPSLDWGMVLEMAKENVTFGAHGFNHYILTVLSSEEKRKEIVESIRIIEKMKIPNVQIFCYPNGDWDFETIHILREIGCKGAVTTRLGLNQENCDPFYLKRIDLHENVSNSIGLFYFRIYQALKN